MAAPNSQLPAVSGNPNIVPKKVIYLYIIYLYIYEFMFSDFNILFYQEDEEEQDAFAIERERLARECKAIE